MKFTGFSRASLEGFFKTRFLKGFLLRAAFRDPVGALGVVLGVLRRGCRVHGFGCRDYGLGLGVWGLGIKV